MNPWDNEPDEQVFEYKGYSCLIRKNPDFLNLLGYVKIPKDSFAYNNRHSLDRDLSVHGGITFTGKLDNYKGYFIGFDCAHWGDYIPSIHKDFLGYTELTKLGFISYKDSAFVRAEIEGLVDQLEILESKE